MDKPLSATISFVCSTLSNEQLFSACLIGLAGWPLCSNDPCYPDAEALFTEPGKRMHPEVLKKAIHEYFKRISEST